MLWIFPLSLLETFKEDALILLYRAVLYPRLSTFRSGTTASVPRLCSREPHFSLLCLLKYFNYISWLIETVCRCMCVGTLGSQLPPSTLWILGIEVRFSGSVSSLSDLAGSLILHLYLFLWCAQSLRKRVIFWANATASFFLLHQPESR